MTGRDNKHSREDAVYGTMAAFLRRHGFLIAAAAPLVLITLVPMGPASVLVVVLIYLGEAIVYAAVQRRRRGLRSGPGPALQALWVVFASCLIIAGLVGLSASGDPVALVAIALGLGIVAWLWSRVARASGEDSRVFVARIGRGVLAAVAAAVGILVVRTIAIEVGIPVIIVVLVTFAIGAALIVWIVSQGLRSGFDRFGTLGYTPPASDGIAVEAASGPVGREPDDERTTPGLGR
jgi:hypothetical protein